MPGPAKTSARLVLESVLLECIGKCAGSEPSSPTAAGVPQAAAGGFRAGADWSCPHAAEGFSRERSQDHFHLHRGEDKKQVLEKLELDSKI